jgi:hypothetical protein
MITARLRQLSASWRRILSKLDQTKIKKQKQKTKKQKETRGLRGLLVGFLLLSQGDKGLEIRTYLPLAGSEADVSASGR